MVNDLKGQKFGRLTVIERAKKENERHAVWLGYFQGTGQPVQLH